MGNKEYIERGEAILAVTRDGCTANVVGVLLHMPAADVVEVRHGEWKQTTEPLGAHDVDCVECSVCGESWVLDEDFDFDVVHDYWNYCPNCGAKMDGGKERL